MRRYVLALAAMASACSSQPAAEQVNATPDMLFEDVRILSADDMQGRLAGTADGAKARAYVLGRYQAVGLKPVFGDSFEQPISIMRRAGAVPSANLIGMIEGTSNSDRTLVVMAHYDHVGVRNGEIYNGADDNASGVATLLAIARSMRAHPPKHDVIFAAVDGEELGMQGSRAMLTDAQFKAILPRVVMAVNFDMVSRNDKNELYAVGTFHFPWLKPRLEAVAAKAAVTLKLGHDDPKLGQKDDWTKLSDHASFHQIGVPWVYFGVEDHAGYHQPGDDFDKIPQDFFKRSAATAEAAVRAFDADLEAIAKDAGR